MAVNVYEGMFILDANRYSRDTAGVSGQIPELIEKAGGETLASRLWEERRLAYQIDGHHKGAYWLTYFKLDSAALAGLTRQCQLSDNILRTMFLKVDPRIADALVSHALADPASRKAEAETTTTRRPAPVTTAVAATTTAAATDSGAATGSGEEKSSEDSSGGE